MTMALLRYKVIKYYSFWTTFLRLATKMLKRADIPQLASSVVHTVHGNESQQLWSP